MPFDASGNFTRNYNFVQDAANGIKILAARVDGEFDNIATGMNAVFFRDGRVPMQADLRMNINGITGLKDGALGSPAIRFNTDPNTGPYLPGLNQYGIMVNSLQRGVFTTAGFDVTGNFTTSGTGAFTGTLSAGAITESGALLSAKYLPIANPGITGTATADAFVSRGVAGAGYFLDPRDATTGRTAIYSNTANTLRISQNGSDQFVMSPTGITVTPTTSFAANTTVNGTFTTNGQITLVNTGASGANLQMNGNGATAPNKTIRAQAGKLEFVNHAYSAVIASFDDVGNFTARDIVASRGDGTGVLYFGASGTNNYIQWDGSRYNMPGTAGIRANSGGFEAQGDCGGGGASYNVGFSHSRAGRVGMHLYNNGAVTEWVMYQPAHAVGDDLRIGSGASGSIADRFKFGTDGNAYALGSLSVKNEIWVGQNDSQGVIRFGNAASASTKFLWYDSSQFQLSASLTVGGNITSSSDARLKSNVRDFGDGLAVVRALRPKRFNMYGKPDFGFVAQELQRVLPEAVSTDTKGFLAVDYGRLTAPLAAAIQSLNDRLDRAGL